jgi:solute carrier family 25 protein 33/36
VFKKILHTEGPGGFFKGIKPMLVGIIPTRAIYFWAYSTSKASLYAKFGNTPVNHLLSAFAAGIASNTVRERLLLPVSLCEVLTPITLHIAYR